MTNVGSAEDFLVQPYDIRMIILRADIGIDDDRSQEAVEAILKRSLTDNEIDKLRAQDGELAITFTFSDCVGVRFIDPDLEDPSATAAHEAVHAACSILRFARVKFAAASEEAYAYLIEYLFKRLREASHA